MTEADDSHSTSETPDDRAKNDALNMVGCALQEMTANLLRVARGAGGPGLIVRQANEIVQACVRYRQVVGHWPPAYDLAEMVSIDVIYPLDQFESETLERMRAERLVIKGALQTVASRMLSQQPQISAGETEMYRGIDRLDEKRKEASTIKATKAPPTPSEIARSIRALNKLKK